MCGIGTLDYTPARIYSCMIERRLNPRTTDGEDSPFVDSFLQSIAAGELTERIRGHWSSVCSACLAGIRAQSVSLAITILIFWGLSVRKQPPPCRRVRPSFHSCSSLVASLFHFCNLGCQSAAVSRRTSPFLPTLSNWETWNP